MEDKTLEWMYEEYMEAYSSSSRSSDDLTEAQHNLILAITEHVHTLTNRLSELQQVGSPTSI